MAESCPPGKVRRGSKCVKYPHTDTKITCYHDRCFKRKIHWDPGKRKEFIMVRRPRRQGGGTKRLYLVRGNVPKHLRHKKRR